MQTVEQMQNSVADDGQTVPTERGNAGEQTNGSVAESQDGAKREWEQMIRSPKYHAIYTEHVSEIIQKRLREQKQSRTILQNAADLLGLEDPEQLPERLQEMMQPAQRNWQAEEGAVREKYPEFDLQAQSSNPEFARLLSGFAASPEVSLTRVYELYALDQLKAAAAKSAAEQAARQVVGALQVRHARPYENGLAEAADRTGRASRLTRAQRAVLAERAAKGEHITF